MKNRILQKEKVQGYLKSLMSEYKVVAPMERKNSPAEFKELKAGDEPILDGSKMMMTAKDYILPRYEALLRVNAKKGSEKIEALLPKAIPTVMLGVWLPDAQGLQVLDKVFLDDKFPDPYYKTRRENTIIVATVPNENRWSWFCTSIDDVDTWKEKTDAVMYDIGDSYYFEVFSEKGAKITDNPLFADASSEDSAKQMEIWQNFKNMPSQSFCENKKYENLEWDNPIWADIAQRCISCGMCSYMCPTCSCFDVQDEVCGDCVERYRCRDTCQFEDFTLMGAGHNPRSQQLPRSRQRLLHKFKYQGEQLGITGCTGCGRCIELCPVNIDIREALNQSTVCVIKEE